MLWLGPAECMRRCESAKTWSSLQLIFLTCWFSCDCHSIPLFSLSVIFLTLKDDCFFVLVIKMCKNIHVKDEATFPRQSHDVLYICKLDSRGRRRDSLTVPSQSISFSAHVHVSSSFPRLCPSIRLLHWCQHSASVYKESCEYFCKGLSNALSIYF